MSYIGDPYQYDVFVSYPHAVDALHGDTYLRDWSQKVAKTIFGILRTSLAEELGGGLEYYLDRERAVSGYALTDELGEAVQKSAVLVVLMSPFYKNWCLKELNWFLEKARSDGRGFRQCVLIEVQKTSEAVWPEELRDKAGVQLFRKSLMGEAGLPLGYEDFITTGNLPNMNGLLQDIAIEIKDKLVQERRRRDAERAIAASKVNPWADLGQGPPDDLLIYLEAEATDRQAWSNRRDALAAARAIVLPDEPLDESMADRSESVLSVYKLCDALILYRARRDDSISPRICRAFHDRRLLYQKDRTKALRWAVLDELPDEPLPYAAAFRIPRVSARDEGWPAQLIQALGGVPAAAAALP